MDKFECTRLNGPIESERSLLDALRRLVEVQRAIAAQWQLNPAADYRTGLLSSLYAELDELGALILASRPETASGLVAKATAAKALALQPADADASDMAMRVAMSLADNAIRMARMSMPEGGAPP